MNVSRKGLHLDFDRLAQAGIMDPITSVTRASSGTVVAADGTIATVAANLPRYTKVGNKRGLLIEEQRTNYVLHSNDMTQNSVWLGGCTRALVSSPLGTVSRLTTSVTNDFIVQNVAVPGAGTWQVSFYARRVAGASSLLVYLPQSSQGGVVTFTDSFQRFVFLATTSGAGNITIQLGAGTGSGNAFQPGDIFEFGHFQVELGGNYYTSPVPSSGAATTRSAEWLPPVDSAAAKVGLNFNAITVVLDFTPLPGTGTGGGLSRHYLHIVTAGGSIWSPGIHLWKWNGGTTYSVEVGKTARNDIIAASAGDGAGVNSGVRKRVAISVLNGKMNIAVNGALVATDIVMPSDLPALDRVILGAADGIGTENVSAIFHELKIVPMGFPSAIVKALSDTAQYPL